MEERSSQLVRLVEALAPAIGHHSTLAPTVKVQRAEHSVKADPVFQPPCISLVIQGRAILSSNVNVHMIDRDHFFLASVPAPFELETSASPAVPLLTIDVEFETPLALEIASALGPRDSSYPKTNALCCTSGRSDQGIKELAARIVTALHDPAACRILMPGLIRELHFHLLNNDEGLAVLAGMNGVGTRSKVLKTTDKLLKPAEASVSIDAIAASTGLSLSSYHSHFKALFGCTPLEYQKAARLHEARSLLRSTSLSIAAIGRAVGYTGLSQFSREFRRHFGHTAREESGSKNIDGPSIAGALPSMSD